MSDELIVRAYLFVVVSVASIFLACMGIEPFSLVGLAWTLIVATIMLAGSAAIIFLRRKSK